VRKSEIIRKVLEKVPTEAPGEDATPAPLLHWHDAVEELAPWTNRVPGRAKDPVAFILTGVLIRTDHAMALNGALGRRLAIERPPPRLLPGCVLTPEGEMPGERYPLAPFVFAGGGWKARGLYIRLRAIVELAACRPGGAVSFIEDDGALVADIGVILPQGTMRPDPAGAFRADERIIVATPVTGQGTPRTFDAALLQRALFWPRGKEPKTITIETGWPPSPLLISGPGDQRAAAPLVVNAVEAHEAAAVEEMKKVTRPKGLYAHEKTDE